MKFPTSTPAMVIALVGAALFSAAPAAAGSDTAQGASAAGGDGDEVVIRDGSDAVPFVANVGPSSSASEPDAFDWGDAAIGAGGALSVMLLASGVVAFARRKGHPAAQPTVPA